MKNNKGPQRGRRGFGEPRRTFGSPDQDAYTLPSAASTPEELLILGALKRCGGDGVPSKSLQWESGIRDKDSFYEALKSLEALREVTIDKDHWVKLVPPSREIEAQIVSLSARFGFAKPRIGEDIFIPGRDLNGAFLGDKVILFDLQKRDKGPSGKVKRIVEHGENKLTGTVHIDEHGSVITPDGPIRYDLEIPSGKLGGAKDGDKVLMEPIQDYRGDWTQAGVKYIFGTGDRARVCADAIIERCGIPTQFPPAVMAQAEDISHMTVTPEDMEERLDLRDEPIFTIDSADAKDLDDAVSAHKTVDGYTLGVHIADVSHYVKAGTPIDNEAFIRGTSVYFADRVIPMLPEALSNGVCSLNAGTEKLTFSALMDFDFDGNMTGYRFEKTVINSKVRGVYSEVNEIFQGTATPNILEKYSPVMDSLMTARELADILRNSGKSRGQMDLTSDETKFVLNDDGVCIDLLPRTQGISEELIEQLMVAANCAAAKASLDAEIPFLYRVHEKPNPDRVYELCDLFDRLGVKCSELKKGTPSTKDFAEVLDRVRGTSKESLVNQRILRTMDKARYDHRELGHFGLALGEYSHFTSPIRRYPDTSIHRILSDLVRGEDKGSIRKKYRIFAEESAVESSKNEVRAVTGERDAEDCYMAEYMRAHLGEHHMGVINGVTPKGIFVKLENNAEGFISLSDFENCDFEFDGEICHKCRRSGKTLMMGQELGIIIAGADVATGRIDFMPEEP
ncbi:MAG: VacB/RNase II family 3'-5' exoribonuclease [Acutalibacter sp.]|jgi:ribonuclease R|uniref:ribonuclease R family protein n=1 Tax=Acutalibacter sp. TaxID=1918636 RepID=UPI00216D9D11|nr:VacB/RNase II family 3'-5' exoribonuclease [Acutalibacter sp.]MCI9224063.1 VacB/RNase II family 3'-5' exoribonuclease [Acutalibacter sp.]